MPKRLKLDKKKVNTFSSKRRVTLKEKIEIFNEFKKTGKELVSSTVFDGYPIGLWAIQIRAYYKDKAINKEQQEKLERLGILERKIDSNLDEKIDIIVEWRRKHPEIKIIPSASNETLKKIAGTDDEYKKLQDEYKIMKKYYDYIRSRYSDNKLDENQVLKCKEGNIGGVFGYPKRIEELAKKYNVEQSDIDYIITKYGTLDNFYEMHKESKIKEKKDKKLESKIIKDSIDVDGNSNKGYDRLWLKINELSRNNYIFYSSEELKRIINDLLLTEEEKKVLNERYGLKDGEMPNSLERIRNDLHLKKSRSRIKQIEYHLLKKIINYGAVDKCCRFNFNNYYIFFNERQREKIKEIKKDIQLQNGSLKEKLKELKAIEENINDSRAYIFHLKNKGKVEDPNKLVIATKQENSIYDTKIEKIKFSTETYNALYKAGIRTLKDIVGKTEKELLKIRQIGNGRLNEIKNILKEYGLCLKEEDKEEKTSEVEGNNTNNDIMIKDMGFSTRTFNSLNRNGITSLGDLLEKSEKELSKIRNLGKNSLKEIKEVLEKHGFYLKEDTKEKRRTRTRVIIGKNDFREVAEQSPKELQNFVIDFSNSKKKYQEH